MKGYIGIDPGKKGAIVRLSEDLTVTNKWVMPIDKKTKDIDLDKLCEIISSFGENDIISLELIHSIHGTGKGSMFTMGRGLGNIEAALVCNDKKIQYVRPKVWQDEVWRKSDIVKIKSKTGKRMVTDTKQSSYNTFRRLYPDVDLRYGDNETIHKNRERTKQHDGLIDAILIATYSYLKH